tara:strand:- start:225 stop:542 length:318 start_codon:yes stop_codon:yes gene_type:complete
MNFSTMSFDDFKKYCAAVTSLEPNAKFSADKKTNTLTWTSGTQPSDSAIETEMARLDALHTTNAYQRSRAAEYPSIADQLDNIYHNGIDAWKATIKTTKDKYPKE